MGKNRFLCGVALCFMVMSNAWAGENLERFFSSRDNRVPVQLYNNRDRSYVIKMNPVNSYVGKPVNSGVCAYAPDELWYLIGTPDSFVMYNHVVGMELALAVESLEGGASVALGTEGTVLCLVPQSDGSYFISPKEGKDQSFNMFGGNGRNIRLYSNTDDGSKWRLRRIDMSRALTLNYKADLGGGYAENTKIGEVAITVDGATTAVMLVKEQLPASTLCYLPEGAEVSVSAGMVCHGWIMDVNGAEGTSPQALSTEGLAVDVNIAVDRSCRYQYLYQTPDANGKPYRIPAIAVAPNGAIFAISDNRPCGMDIGYGEVDIKCRMSGDGGETWGEEFFIADGQGGSFNVMSAGYGDAAVVADREENRLLVMMVCGKTVCWNGRWTPEKSATDDAVNRVARVYATYNKKSKIWEWTQPEEVTDEIYRLFLKDGVPTVSSMFIGSGRIAQSSKVKVGDYYRLYCAMWTRDQGNRVIYSDDFGKSWHILGAVDDRPAPYGDEPKCEELPDGSVLLSSRKGYGRYFNVFKYTDAKSAKGAWQEVVATDQVGDLKWGANSTNGEVLRIGNVLFQSAPVGDGRTDVSVFYKVLGNSAEEYTPVRLSQGWSRIPISTLGSAYSSMCVLPDGNIGMLYEEAPGSYSIVYVPIILKEVLPEEVYKATKVEKKRKWCPW